MWQTADVLLPLGTTVTGCEEDPETGYLSCASVPTVPADAVSSPTIADDWTDMILATKPTVAPAVLVEAGEVPDEGTYSWRSERSILGVGMAPTAPGASSV